MDRLSAAGAQRPLVLFDLSRLIARVARPAPTGIDRVELAYAEFLLAQRDWEVRFVACSGDRIKALPDTLARALVGWVGRTWVGTEAGGATAAGLARVAGFLGVAAPPVAARAVVAQPDDGEVSLAVRLAIDPIGRLLQNPVRLWAVGALEPVIAAAAAAGRSVAYLHVSHHNLQKAEPFRRLKASGPVKVAILVHDLIPIEYPEFSRPGDDVKHAARMATVAEVADLVIVNSADTGRRFAAHLARTGAARMPEVTVAHLGIPAPHGLGDGFAAGGPPYFAVVSTIEARKNHYLLLNLWRTLDERFGAAAPKLVVVGRRGWEVENVIDLLERSPAAKAHVLEAGSLSDQALATVLAGARAVLMPSLVEGYGLPVVEALSTGVPVIASDIPVHVEVGQGVAELIDPLDGPAWIDAILDYAAPDSPRRAAQIARMAGYVTPTWTAHFEIARNALVRLMGG